ncbi:MAG: hypothetical protein ABW092_15210, partial [Candidatus Thiodiazotropha sp.]
MRINYLSVVRGIYNEQKNNIYSLDLSIVICSAILLVTAAQKSHASSFLFDSSLSTPYPDEIQVQNILCNDCMRVLPDGSKLVNGKGDNVRLWGGVLRITNEILDKSDSQKEKMISNLANAGFNEIRIIGIDFDDPGIYKSWKSSGTFP